MAKPVLPEIPENPDAKLQTPTWYRAPKIPLWADKNVDKIRGEHKWRWNDTY